jgi:peptide/nickel transport system substrate-binding protein
VRSGHRFLAAVAALTCGLAVLTTASAEKTKYGGVLTVDMTNGAVLGGPLDPTLNPSSVSGFGFICEGLYTTDLNLNYVPQLAIGMPTISADKLTYTVQLRQGALFNDGTPFNAQAVVTTYQRDINLPGSLLASTLSAIDTVTATGPYTVVFHLKSRFSPMLNLLTEYIMSPTQLQKLGTNFGSDPVCVGPFMYDSQVVGLSTTLIKSPYFFDKYAVHFDKIVLVAQANTGAAAAALEAGDVQAVDNLNPSDLPGIQATKSLALIRSQVDGGTALYVNLSSSSNASGNPLAQSPKLLQAFEEALDRNALAKVLAPLADPGCTVIPHSSPYYDSTLKCTPYDPADARKLVAASGIPNPTIHLLAQNATRQQLIAQFIQAEEAAVGIKIIVDTVDAATAAADTVSGGGGNYQVYDTYSIPAVDPALTLLPYLQASDNRSGFSTPQLSLIVANLLKATSLQSQKTLLHTALQIILKARPIITLYNINRYLAYNTELTGVQAANGNFYRLAFAQYKG